MHQNVRHGTLKFEEKNRGGGFLINILRAGQVKAKRMILMVNRLFSVQVLNQQFRGRWGVYTCADYADSGGVPNLTTLVDVILERSPMYEQGLELKESE